MPNTKTKAKKALTTKPKKALKKPVASRQATKKAAPVAVKQAKATAKPSAPSPKIPFKKEVTQKLKEAKARILQEVSEKVRSESNTQKFEIGDIYDIASNERERELNLMFGDRDRGKLAEIEDALERIKDNTYGGCEECGEPIAENRLRALPFTRVCVECQSKLEREQKIKGRVEEESGLGIMEGADTEEEF
ncbi:MAG: TraR/DksA C4-type zinc finger protein [Deltaproteobacteria bacterium]|nr:TraR/DksA C4-type zinc finger protein [Deltaproteobacteria bacterium]